jgi:hypothetical protein
VGRLDASRYANILREFGLGEEDLAAWRKSRLPDEAFEDWLTDRVARRPSGTRAREVYGSDDVHGFARRAILDMLLGTATTFSRSDVEEGSYCARPSPRAHV